MLRGLLLTLGGTAVLAGAACAPAPRAFVAEPLSGEWVVAVLPLSNFTANRDASDRLGPMILVELSRRPGFRVVETGRVEEALAGEPWMLADRIPPDLVDSLGTGLGANALLVGSVLAYGYRMDEGEDVPEVSISLRLLEVPGGRVLWSAVHNRGGTDRESVFGLGRVGGLEKLGAETVREVLETFPKVDTSTGGNPADGKGRPS